MTESPPLPDKQDVAEAFLGRGTLFVHLDPRAEGVLAPPWLCEQAQLVLQVGYDMAVPIEDLCVDAEGVRGTLSFNRSSFLCDVPWHAVFALVGDEGRGMVWPESMPGEIAAEVDREARRVGMRLIKGEGEDGDAPLKAVDAKSVDPQGPDEDGESEPEDRARRLDTTNVGRRKNGPRPVEETDAPQTATQDNKADSEPPDLASTTRTGRKLPPYLKVVK